MVSQSRFKYLVVIKTQAFLSSQHHKEFMLYTQRSQVWMLTQKPAILMKIFYGFPQFLHANAMIMPEIIPDPDKIGI